jgi:hypothetical protein
MNVGIGTEAAQFLFPGINKLDFRYSVTPKIQDYIAGDFSMDEEEANKAARFEQQIVVFFGTKERAEAFWRLQQPEQRLEAVWALPVMQDLLRKNNLSVHEKSLGMSHGKRKKKKTF